MNITLRIVLLCSFAFSVISRDRVTANIASMPSRVVTLEQVINSIIEQVDHVNVYLNNYSEIPSFLKNQKISVFTSQNHGDLGSNGKFFLSGQFEGYYFTLDDDLIYPDNYVEYLISKIEYYKRKAVVGIHGSIFDKEVTDFFKHRTVFSFKTSLKKDIFVNILGTGTTAYHTDTIKINLECFPYWNKDDLCFAIAAKKQRIPLICLERPVKYITALPTAYDSNSIYETSKHNNIEHVTLVNQNAPWEVLTLPVIY